MEKDMLSTRTARKCAEISRILEKEESRSHVRRVAHILKKSENDRSDEEKLLLLNSVDIVLNIEKRANSRMLTKQRLLEIEDSEDVLREKCVKLAAVINDARHLIIYTGAGISTAASIPDYRGPNGVWTLLQQGKEVIVPQLSDADPTYTHMCITSLYRQHLVKHVVSQNCDALHLRSGLPRHALSELHGNMHIEVCNSCNQPREHIRLFDLTERTGVRRHQTGRKCSHCGAPLQDTIVHFGEKGRLTSPYNWKEAARAADHTDVILCLGTSLKVLKKYPCLWSMHKPPTDRPKLYIVNLQWTPKDDIAALKINGRSDEVMKYVITYLDLPQPVPSYVREEDPIFLMATPLAPHELETTSTKSLVEPPGYRREKLEAILLDDIAASKKLNNGGKNRYKRKKQSDSCGRGSRKATEQQNGSRKKGEKYKVDAETVSVNETQDSKRCRKDVWMEGHLEPDLCNQHSFNTTAEDGVHSDDGTRHGVTVSKSDTAAAQLDSTKIPSSQGSRSSGSLGSRRGNNGSGMECELCDNVGMTGDNSEGNCEKSGESVPGKTSVHGGECMLEHAYCRSCYTGAPEVTAAVSSVADNAAIPAYMYTPSTTNSPSFTHIKTRTVQSPGCSSIRCCQTNDESSMSECLSDIDVNCSISPAQCISAVHGDGICTMITSSGISDSLSIKAAAQQGTQQLANVVRPAQDIITSCSLAKSAFSGGAKASVGGKFPTIIGALHAGPQQTNEAHLRQCNVGPTAKMTSSPQPHSEQISGTPTHECGETKSSSVSDGVTVERDISVGEMSKHWVTTSAECDGVNSYESSTEYATIPPVDGSQESNRSHLGMSSTTPGIDTAGIFVKKEGDSGKVGSGGVKETQGSDSSRNTITATSPGWFGKGLSFRKARRKKSW